MIKRENKIFTAIESGRAPIGFFNYIKDPTIQYIGGAVGMDFTHYRYGACHHGP